MSYSLLQRDPYIYIICPGSIFISIFFLQLKESVVKQRNKLIPLPLLQSRSFIIEFCTSVGSEAISVELLIVLMKRSWKILRCYHRVITSWWHRRLEIRRLIAFFEPRWSEFWFLLRLFTQIRLNEEVRVWNPLKVPWFLFVIILLLFSDWINHSMVDNVTSLRSRSL